MDSNFRFRAMQTRLKTKIAGLGCMPPSIICGWPSVAISYGAKRGKIAGTLRVGEDAVRTSVQQPRRPRDARPVTARGERAVTLMRMLEEVTSGGEQEHGRTRP